VLNSPAGHYTLTWPQNSEEYTFFYILCGNTPSYPWWLTPCNHIVQPAIDLLRRRCDVRVVASIAITPITTIKFNKRNALSFVRRRSHRLKTAFNVQVTRANLSIRRSYRYSSRKNHSSQKGQGCQLFRPTLTSTSFVPSTTIDCHLTGQKRPFPLIYRPFRNFASFQFDRSTVYEGPRFFVAGKIIDMSMKATISRFTEAVRRQRRKLQKTTKSVPFRRSKRMACQYKRLRFNTLGVVNNFLKKLWGSPRNCPTSLCIFDAMRTVNSALHVHAGLVSREPDLPVSDFGLRASDLNFGYSPITVPLTPLILPI
jgi:hypothetical protein